MKDSYWPVFTNVKTNSRRVKFLTFRSFGNLTSFCIGIAVSGLMLSLKAKDSARILSLKRPSAGTRNGSAAIPSAFAPKQHSLSAPRRFGAANSQVPSICNHILSASQLFPIKNLYLFCENTLNLTNGSFRSHHILKS